MATLCCLIGICLVAINGVRIIQYFHLNGFGPSNIKTKLFLLWGSQLLYCCKIQYWQGQQAGEHRNGRSHEVTMPETVKTMYKMVLNDRRIKVCDLANMVDITKSAVHRILTKIWPKKVVRKMDAAITRNGLKTSLWECLCRAFGEVLLE